jgi:hypothetical protein
MGLGSCSLLSYIRLLPYAVVLILSSTFPQPLSTLYTKISGYLRCNNAQSFVLKHCWICTLDFVHYLCYTMYSGEVSFDCVAPGV